MQRLGVGDRFLCLLKGLLNWQWRISSGCINSGNCGILESAYTAVNSCNTLQKGANEEALKNLSRNIVPLGVCRY